MHAYHFGLPLSFFALRFRLLMLRDVGCDPVDADDGSCGVVNRARPITQPANLTSGPQNPIFDLGRVGRQNSGEKLQHSLKILGMHDSQPQLGVGHEIGHQPAIDPLGGWIEVENVKRRG